MAARHPFTSRSPAVTADTLRPGDMRLPTSAAVDAGLLRR
jgi:hypothetical protein